MMRRRRAAEQTEHEAAQGTAGAGEGVEPAAEERGEDDVVSDRRGDGAGGRRQARGQENEDDGQGRREGKGRGQGQRGRTETQKTWVSVDRRVCIFLLLLFLIVFVRNNRWKE